jgi:tetratricopeptide (TPR) repeat protein
MRAWFAGDFEECLVQCERVRTPDADMLSQLALLRARALLRMGRPDEAIAVVARVFIAPGRLDASLTARMLLGTAYVRRGEHAAGLRMLSAAYRASRHAHPTVRSEIALNIGLARYGMRELDEADRALDLVSEDSDIVHARALEYRGWVAIVRGDYAAATRQFEATLRRLDDCRHHDRFLEANAIQALAILAAERLDRRAFLLAEHRAAQIDWTAGGLATPLFGVMLSASMMHEIDGGIAEALRRCREAEAVAASDGARVVAVCRRAAILRGAGERFAHADLVARARRDVRAVDFTRCDGDERHLPLALAIEVAATGDVAEARALLRQYDELPPPSAMLALTGDPRPVAVRAFAQAAVADAAGDRAQAHYHYGEAFGIFHRIGYERRALLAALRLGELTGQRYLLDYVDRTLRKLSARSPLRARARRSAR